jgi:hypothetical protein
MEDKELEEFREFKKFMDKYSSEYMQEFPWKKDSEKRRFTLEERVWYMCKAYRAGVYTKW